MTAQAAPLELAAANRALHDALLAKATSRQLTRMITVLNAQSMRYHVLALAKSDTKGLVLSHDDGLRLALDERDPGQVAEILNTHLSALRGAASMIDRDAAATTPGLQ
jgi:DNA-binding GntR family transcriptional regulator